MQIREATLADLADLQGLEQAAFAGDRLSRRQLRHHLLSTRSQLLLAEDAQSGHDGPLGYGLLLTRAGSQVGRIYSIAVADHARGRGLGRALLQALEQRAMALGLAWMRLEVRADNDAAQRLYASHGYQHCGSREGYYEDGMAAQLWRRALGTVPVASFLSP